MTLITTKTCECGCGRAAPIARKTRSALGHVKGHPVRFLPGHANGLKVGTRYKDGRVSIENRGHTSPCWLWMLARGPTGYGQEWCPTRRLMVAAHILAYERARGPVPEGMELDHLCRVRSCVNPDHLEPVTHAENVRRGALARAST